ncbi:MAG: hypothetical protein H0W20_01315 [Chthoniobacterales bacterium]|nr:hypothetical protein [Chthoniobacterales bacterium]
MRQVCDATATSTRKGAASLSALLLALLATAAAEEAPYGLDERPPVGPYLNNAMPPTSDGSAFPPVLSATGAFRDVRTLTPSNGLIPFALNSPLWTDGAIKSRWMAVPNDRPPYDAAELRDPLLELFDGNGDLIARNDNWKEAQRAEIEATTIPPPQDLEAAIVRCLRRLLTPRW